MVFRITVTEKEAMASVRVEGRLEASGVADLRDACCRRGGPVRLDLSGLQSADEVGLNALCTLRAEGHEFHGATPYFEQLLKQR